MNLETASANVRKMDEAIKFATVTEVLPEGASGAPDDIDLDEIAHPYENVENMDGAVEAAAIPDQHNEESVESDALTKKTSNDPEDMDAEVNTNPEVSNDQDEESTSDTEEPEYSDANASFLPEVSEDYEVPFEGSRDQGNTQKTPDYDTTMYFYVTNIDKIIKISGVKSTRKLMNLALDGLNYFPEHFNPCKKHPNNPQKIQDNIKKKEIIAW